MGKVLIIKNNNSDERIHRYAMESYEPVSYTHLDVYKRQPLHMDLSIREYIRRFWPDYIIHRKYALCQ